MDILKPTRIITGWFYSKIWAPMAAKKRSRERLKECANCDDAIDSLVLKFINGEAEQIKCKACRFCGCPVVEKSLVKSEKCHLNKWKDEPKRNSATWNRFRNWLKRWLVRQVFM